MGEDLIRYDLVVQNALRGGVRDVLKRVAAEGLPGDHHFYIAFQTGAPGVKLSPKLKSQYPEDMTIVLQHQFWDLRAEPDHFEVKLSFNNVTEQLVIPYAAIRSFVDPSVEFGLQFAQSKTDGDAAPGKTQAGKPSAVQKPLASVPAAGERSAARKAGKKDAGPKPDEKPARPAARQGEVVQLDAFRKKS